MESLFGKKKRAPGGALVVYTTKHGQTQRYAERIAQPLDALIKEAAYMKGSKAATYDVIVVGCCVYQGKVHGLDFLQDNREELKGKRIVVYTCGILDPEIPEIKTSLDHQVQEALGEELADAKVFHMRGAIHWRSLGIMEHVKMKKWLSQIKKTGDRSEAENQLLEAEGGVIDFADEADCAAVVAAARGLEGAL